MSAVECHTSKISKLNLMQNLIKDTAGFINKINDAENITEETFLVTSDVKSLFMNIPNHEGIEAGKVALNAVPKKPVATKVIKCSDINF